MGVGVGVARARACGRATNKGFARRQQEFMGWGVIEQWEWEWRVRVRACGRAACDE